MFKYQLISLQKVDKPEFVVIGTLYHYVIANKFNQISGYRSGTQVEVKQHINEVIERLDKKLIDLTGANNRQVYKVADLSSYI